LIVQFTEQRRPIDVVRLDYIGCS